MPRRKRAKRTTVKDIRTILRLTHEHGLSVRAVSDRLGISKTTVATYLLRAREAGLTWPLPPIYERDAALERALFRRVWTAATRLERARIGRRWRKSSSARA
jgi:DNA-binding transcriptional regulator LsrR (DeoR family)